MKTYKHVQYILGIAYKRMWAIRKLQKASISPKDIIHFFNMKIRSVLETNCPVFHPMLTQEQSDDIERPQKILLKIILQENYTSYSQACKFFDIKTLKERRTQLSLKFALRILENAKFHNFFKPNINMKNVRHQEKFQVPFARTSRYQNSPKVYLTKLLNEHFSNN